MTTTGSPRGKTIAEFVVAGVALLIAVFSWLAACDANDLSHDANGFSRDANGLAQNANEIARRGLDLSEKTAQKQEAAEDMKLAESVSFTVDRRESENPPVVRVTVINNGITPIRVARFESKGEDGRITIVPIRDVRECVMLASRLRVPSGTGIPPSCSKTDWGAIGVVKRLDSWSEPRKLTLTHLRTERHTCWPGRQVS